MSTVQLTNLDKVYPDGHPAVTDLNLAIEDGEFVILVGPSGCGKSTALRMIAGLEEITAGTVRIGDRVMNDLTPKERDIAMVFQSYALYPHMTVAENLGFSLRLAKHNKSEIDRHVQEAATVLGLADLLHRKPKALSGGQRQRVAMGRAIVRNPQCFLMDEPLSNLDARLRVQMRAEIAALQNRLGVTTIFVTHDQTEAMTMGQRVAVLKRGRLQQVDTPQTLYDSPDNVFVAGFIGSPSMNLGLVRLDGTPGRPTIDVGGQVLPLAEETVKRHPGVTERVGQEVIVGVRPEHFVRRAESDVALWRDLPVTLVERLGSEMLVHFTVDVPPVLTEDVRESLDDDAFEALEREAATGHQTYVARFDPGDPPRVGERIDVGVCLDKLHFFDPRTGTSLR